MVNSKDVGVSGTSASVPCNHSSTIQIKLNGYESISENVFIKQNSERMFRTLKKMPMGQLELTVNRNAKLYINDQFIGEASPNQVFAIPLRANQKHRIRFKNEIYGIDTVKEFPIEEGIILRRSILLDEVPQKRKPSGR